MTNSMAMECVLGKTEQATPGTGRTARNTAGEYSERKTEANTLACSTGER